MTTTTKKKLCITIVASVLLGILYSLIFSFSAQDGDTSGSVSMGFSKVCVELADKFAGGEWSDDRITNLAESVEIPIRKAAHFSEYALMGVLVYVLWSQWLAKRVRLYTLTVIWVMLSAAGDELHQTFVPGRWGSIKDVLLDTAGGVFGLLLCIIITKQINKRRNKAAAV